MSIGDCILPFWQVAQAGSSVPHIGGPVLPSYDQRAGPVGAGSCAAALALASPVLASPALASLVLASPVLASLVLASPLPSLALASPRLPSPVMSDTTFFRS